MDIIMHGRPQNPDERKLIMKKMLLSFVATLMLLAMPSAVFAAGSRDDNSGNAMRGNQYVNRYNNMNDDNNLRINGNMANDGFQTMNTNNNRRFNTNNNNWNNNMTTRSVDNGNVYRTNAANNNDTDWGWLGLLGLIGLAGMMGRNRDRGDIK